MKNELNQIREILDTLELTSLPYPAIGTLADFSALDLPLIVQEIVDNLQPLLIPYEAAIYWYLFRHSIVANGSPYLRTSGNRLCKGVVKSARSGRAENPIAPSKIKEILRELEILGAIRKEGEPNREGTLYRIFVPDEIEACRNFRNERIAEKQVVVGVVDAEIDYYNVRDNRVKIFERDDYHCYYCSKQLTRFTATLDHITPVAKGGDNSLANLITACLHCNSRKNKRAVGDFLAES